MGQRFPVTESCAAGVPFGGTLKELTRPLFIVIFLCMWLTAATELGPGQWISNIFNDVIHSTLQAGVLLLVWINGLMYAMASGSLEAPTLRYWPLRRRPCSPSALPFGGRQCWV